MFYIIPGIVTIIAIVILATMFVEDDFDDPWRAGCLWVVGLTVLWYAAYQLQSHFDASDAASAAAKKEVYDRCIVETETFVNKVSTVHIIVDKCASSVAK